MDASKIGARIYEQRKALNMTLQDIADQVRVARSTIQRYEAGTIKQMKMPVLYSIAQALHVNPNWLIGISDTKEFIEPFYRAAIQMAQEEQLRALSPEARSIAVAFDLADQKSKEMVRLALSDYLDTSSPSAENTRIG